MEEGVRLSSAGPLGERLLPVQIDHRRWSSSPESRETSRRGPPRVQRPQSDDGAWPTRVVEHWSLKGCGGGIIVSQLRLSSSPGGLLPRGPHQNRTRRFPPSGSSADVAHGDAPQIRTRIRGTGRGYRSNNATNLGQGSTTFRISGDMSPDVNAPVMGPFESSHQHGPPLLGRVRGPTRSPTSSLVCSPPTPSLPSAAAPVVPGRWPTLSLVRQGGRRASQVPGPSSSSVP